MTKFKFWQSSLYKPFIKVYKSMTPLIANFVIYCEKQGFASNFSITYKAKSGQPVTQSTSESGLTTSSLISRRIKM